MTWFNLIIAILGIGISIAAFYIGRLASAKKSGERVGMIDERLANIDKNLSSFRDDFQNSHKEVKEDIYRESVERRKSIERLHEKFDEHILNSHKKGKRL